MNDLIISNFNCETQELIERPITDQEYAQKLIDKEVAEARAAEAADKQAEIDAAKAALQEKLSELGITPELIEVIKKL